MKRTLAGAGTVLTVAREGREEQAARCPTPLILAYKLSRGSIHLWWSLPAFKTIQTNLERR